MFFTLKIALVAAPKGSMEVAPSVNEILIRTSPECLCSRMRNMEKMGKEWGDLLSILGGLNSSHNNLTFYVSVFFIVARRVLPSAFI